MWRRCWRSCDRRLTKLPQPSPTQRHVRRERGCDVSEELEDWRVDNERWKSVETQGRGDNTGLVWRQLCGVGHDHASRRYAYASRWERERKKNQTNQQTKTDTLSRRRESNGLTVLRTVVKVFYFGAWGWEGKRGDSLVADGISVLAALVSMETVSAAHILRSSITFLSVQGSSWTTMLGSCSWLLAGLWCPSIRPPWLAQSTHVDIHPAAGVQHQPRFRSADSSNDLGKRTGQAPTGHRRSARGGGSHAHQRGRVGEVRDGEGRRFWSQRRKRRKGWKGRHKTWRGSETRRQGGCTRTEYLVSVPVSRCPCLSPPTSIPSSPSSPLSLVACALTIAINGGRLMLLDTLLLLSLYISGCVVRMYIRWRADYLTGPELILLLMRIMDWCIQTINVFFKFLKKSFLHSIVLWKRRRRWWSRRRWCENNEEMTTTIVKSTATIMASRRWWCWSWWLPAVWLPLSNLLEVCLTNIIIVIIIVIIYPHISLHYLTLAHPSHRWLTAGGHDGARSLLTANKWESERHPGLFSQRRFPVAFAISPSLTFVEIVITHFWNLLCFDCYYRYPDSTLFGHSTNLSGCSYYLIDTWFVFPCLLVSFFLCCSYLVSVSFLVFFLFWGVGVFVSFLYICFCFYFLA